MTTYKGINGFAVQSVATDPSPLDEGQVWYNNATYAFKLASVTTAGTFASGGSLPVALYGTMAAGTQTAAVNSGGYIGSGPTVAGKRATTNEYDGTSWTSSNDMNTARWNGKGTGIQTASLAISGTNPSTPGTSTDSESYNGSTWTTTSSLNTNHVQGGASGTQTAALMFAGGNPITAATESWNGSSWTSLPATMNTARIYLAGCGTQTAALGFGGLLNFNSAPNYPVTAATESYNGTSWTTVNSLNTSRGYLAGAGTQTAAVAFGGWTPPGGILLSSTELWNGTSWTSNPTGLSTARCLLAGAGTQTLALAIGGNSPVSAATEEWTGPGSPVTQTITTS